MKISNVTPAQLEVLTRQYREAYDQNTSPLEISAIAHNFRSCGMTDTADELDALAQRRADQESNKA